MPVIWRRNGYSIDVFGREEFAEVFASGGRGTERFFCLGNEFLQDVALHVAHVSYLCISLIRFDRGEVS